MSKITLDGKPTHTSSELPIPGTKAADFKLTATDLTTKTLKDFEGNNIIMNIFPSLDTNTCAQTVRTFNKKAALLPNTKVLCISRDLPFAHHRFCTNEGLKNVINLSDFKTGDFGKIYGLNIIDGPFQGLHSRCVVVISKDRTILHTEQVGDIGNEPDYDAAINALS